MSQQRDDEVDLSMFDDPDVDTSMFDESDVDTSMFGEEPAPKERPDVSYAESGLRGAAQGATMGWADELLAGGDAFLDDVGALFAGHNNNKGGTKPEYDERGEVTNGSELTGNYRDHLKEERAKFDAAQAANPKTFMAGGLAGSMAIPGGTGVIKSAGMGALDALGQSEEESAGGLLQDALAGAALSGGMAGVTKGLGARQGMARKAGLAADHAAEDAAGLTRTLGQRKKLMQELEGDKLADGEVGRYLRSKGLVNAKDSVEDIAHNIAARRGRVGKEIEGLVGEGQPVSVSQLAKRLKSKVDDYGESGVSEETKHRLSAVADNYKKVAKPETQEVSKLVDAKGNPIVLGTKPGKDTIPLEQIRRDRTSVGKKVGDFLNSSPTKQADKDIYAELSDVLRTHVKDPAAYAAKNREYNLIKHVDDNAMQNAAAVQGKQGLRVGNIVPAVLGMKAGGMLGAAGAVMANNANAQRGAQMRMAAFQKLENLLKTPEAIPAPIRNVLMNAAQRGQLAATHAILSKNVPEYEQWLAETPAAEESVP